MTPTSRNRPPPTSQNKENEAKPEQPPLKASFPIVGIGASAGGLEAIGELLKSLPPDTGMAFIIVQHLAPDHVSALAEILSKKTRMSVTDAAEGHPVEPNHVYIIPPNAALTIVECRLVLKPRSNTAGFPMPIDDLFHSLAEDQGSNAIGISLSGAGSDGALGIQSIKNEGGITFAQDEMSAQYSSMPRAAVGLGCVDFVLAPPEIASELVRISRHPLRVGTSTDDLERLVGDEKNLKQIFRLLQGTCNLDFTHYKSGTIKRRLARRIKLQNLNSVPDYINFLEANPGELKSLCQDFLIRVTSFFRDSDTFDNLIHYVFPRIIEEHSTKGPLRIWVAGCSTGEEVYSLAICCLEYLREHGIGLQIQIFGTDVSEDALQIARAGIYVGNIARNVSPERLEKFFVKTGDHYQVSKSVRDLCIFARHNVTSDPPFSRLDLISCRNLLIYLNPLMQKRVIPLFHYALKPEGILMLGPAENIGGFTDIFTLSDDKKIKFYTKKPLPVQSQLKYLEDSTGKTVHSLSSPPPFPSSYPDFSQKKYTEAEQQKREVDRITLGRYVPASVLCDKNMNILELRGDTDPYLTLPSGPPDTNLQKLARPGLIVELSKAVQKAGKDGAPVRIPGLRVEASGGNREITLEVIPVQRSAAEEPRFLIFFEDKIHPARSMAEVPGFWLEFGRFVRQGMKSGRRDAQQGSNDDELLRSKRELDDTRDYIRTMVEEYEVTKEELQASQEELLSSNEEFQSTNEELETSKEELQSANEELVTTNEEMHHRNRELNVLNDKLKLALNYAEEVTKTAHQPFLVLDENLHILRANPAFYKTFKTTPETTEGCLLYDLGDRQWDIPELREFLQALLLKDTSFKDCEITHAFPNIGKKTMRLNGKNLTGVEQFKILLAIEDVSDYRTAINYAETTIKTVTQPFLVLDENLCILRANPAFYKSFKTTPETTEGRLLYDLGDKQWDIPELREFLQALLLKDTSFKDCEITHVFPNVGKKTMRLNGTQLVGGGQLQILLAIEDVSDYRTALNTLKDNDRHKDEFLAMLAHELRNPLTPIRNALDILKRDDVDEKARKELKSVMDRQLRKMVRLVDDLLDVSRITSGIIVLKKEPVDLVQLVNQTVESVRNHFEARQHELSVSLPKEGMIIKGDPIRLEQIVSNLLINASKYTEPGGHITVTLECEKDNALIRVIDNGIGISSDILPYIFDLFVQAERSLDRKQGGLGLGLTLVRRLVELHGGTVEARSEGRKKGSEFIVRLPIISETEVSLPLEPTVAPKKTPSTGRRVLIVDDNVDAALTTQMLLELQGHQVQFALDGPFRH